MSTVFEILTSFFDSLICVYFIMKFNRGTWLESKTSIPAVFVLFFVTLAGDYLMPGFSVVSTLVLFVVTVVYALSICKKHYIRAVLSACIYKIVYILLSSLLYMVISSVIRDFDSLMQGSSDITRYIYILLHKILLVAVLSIFLYVFNSESLSDLKTGIMTFIVSIVTVVGLGATMTIISDTAGESYQNQIIVLICSFIAINIGLYTLVSQVQKLQKNKYELKLLQDKMKFQEDKYNDAVAVWDNIRKVQHDMKQHLIVIDGILEDGKTDDCQNYVSSLIPNVNRMGKLIHSDNVILDYLINSKLCSLTDTQVVVSGTVGDLSDIPETDLACLMGNILDNAIEAVTPLEKKRIELLFLRQNSNRIIICKNTVAGSVLRENSKLASTKKDAGNHGYGHLIIEKVAEEHGGMVDYFEEYGMFGVQVILPAKRES